LNNICKIISEGRYKGKRFYDESLYDGAALLPLEINFYFKNALNNNYKIFVLNCSCNHNILIPQNDLIFLEKMLDCNEDTEIYTNHNFSDEVIKIKEFQYFDIKQLYNIAIKKNQIGSLFINPFLEKNFYCFNVCLVVNKDFDLNEILNFKFNLIKVTSINEYKNIDNLISTFFKNLYNLDYTKFKDYFVTWEELKQTRPYDELELQERKNYNNYCRNYLDFTQNNPHINVDYMEKELDILEKKWFDKEEELWDVELYKKLHFKKLCMHFYIFHEILLSDSIFFTNFLQIMGGVKANFDEYGGLKIDENELQSYSLEDMFNNDPYQLFTIFIPVFQWGKK